MSREIQFVMEGDTSQICYSDVLVILGPVASSDNDERHLWFSALQSMLKIVGYRGTVIVQSGKNGVRAMEAEPAHRWMMTKMGDVLNNPCCHVVFGVWKGNGSAEGCDQFWKELLPILAEKHTRQLVAGVPIGESFEMKERACLSRNNVTVMAGMKAFVGELVKKSNHQKKHDAA